MALIDDILEQVRLRGDAPVDDREAESVSLFLALAPCLAQPFDEHADAVHITGSALVTSERGVIILKHKRLGIWVQPGGHIDDGETPAEAAVRESCEETGLEVTLVDNTIIHVDVHPGPRGHTHLDLRYLCTAPPVDPSPGADESPEAYWFGWDEAIERAEAGLRGLLVARRPRR